MPKRVPAPQGELALIDQIRCIFSGRGRSVALGIGDDCAILTPPPGHELLVTTDFSIENRHFRRDLHPAHAVGHRCLARGLSDIAAMGGTPLAAFLSLALPGKMLSTSRGRRWVEGFLSGIHDLAQATQTPLAGGDTSESPADLIFADIIVVGSAPRGRALRRSGARAGDGIYVTGKLGGSHTELSELFSSKQTPRIDPAGDHPHLYPHPQIKVGAALLKRRLASAAIDLSDGLSTDLAHLCRASGVRAEIDSAALPLHPMAKRLKAEEALNGALNGGEDYELLFTAPASVHVPRSIVGVPLTRIGSVRRRDSRKPLVTLIDNDGKRRELPPGGWQHLTDR